MPFAGIKSVWDGGNLTLQNLAGASLMTFKTDGSLTIAGNTTFSQNVTVTGRGSFGNITSTGNSNIFSGLPTSFQGNYTMWLSGNATKLLA